VATVGDDDGAAPAEALVEVGNVVSRPGTGEGTGVLAGSGSGDDVRRGPRSSAHVLVIGRNNAGRGPAMPAAKRVRERERACRDLLRLRLEQAQPTPTHFPNLVRT
jgi:hypothetical protein